MRKNQTFCLESPLFRGKRKTKLYACAYNARVRAHMRVRVHNIYGRMLKIDAQYLVLYSFFCDNTHRISHRIRLFRFGIFATKNLAVSTRFSFS